MASVYTSQTNGVSVPAIDAARRREQQRKVAYRPSMSGLTESDMESAIARAAVANEDTTEAVDEVRAAAQTRLRTPMSDTQPGTQPEGQSPYALREPMTGAPQMGSPRPALRAPLIAETGPPSPEAPSNKVSAVQGAYPAPTSAYRPDAQTSADNADREAAIRAARARRGIGIAGAISALFGERENDAQRLQAIAAARDANDPQMYLQRIDDRRDARAQAAQDAEAARIAEEERGLNRDYRQTLMRSMDVNANRREVEMGRRSEADARLYDPTHPVATQRREFLRRIIGGAPEIAEGMRGQDLDALGSADLKTLTDQMLRRIGQVPNRYRQADIAELMRVAAELDAQDAAPAEAESVAEQPAPMAAARRRAPATQDDGAPMPAAPQRRDRTLAEINADILAERAGQPTSTGLPAREMTPAERVMVARSLERSRTRIAGSLAGGIDTQSREAQGAATASGTMLATTADVERVRRPYSRVAPLAREINDAIREFDRLATANGGQLSQAQFEAMRSGGVLARMTNTETLSALTSAFTNAQLREQSGAAVTDSEAARFFRALNMNALNDPRAFRAALIRARSAVLNDLETLRNSNPQAYDVVRGRR